MRLQRENDVGKKERCIEIHLIGFGDDRPACFDNTNRFSFQTSHPITPRQLLEKSGFPNSSGLIFMSGDTVIPENRWDEPLINNEDRITLMSAIEGG
ncbi:MAG: hypothetical protein ACR2QW_05825 [bacterium]